MKYLPHTIICVALIISILLVTAMGEGSLQTTAMAAFTTALGVSIAWFFGTRQTRR